MYNRNELYFQMDHLTVFDFVPTCTNRTGCIAKMYNYVIDNITYNLHGIVKKGKIGLVLQYSQSHVPVCQH